MTASGQWRVDGSYARGGAFPGSATVDVVLPVYNEAHVLADSVGRVRRFLQGQADFAWRIVIADNASVDGTLETALRLASAWPEVAVLHIPFKGRGGALHIAWTETEADVRTYMDIDLSTGLPAFLDLVHAVTREGYDLATGTRLHRGSAISRSFRRDVLSRGYNLLIKLTFATRFSDAQCGFKAISASAARLLLPVVHDREWFFDTELLILAEKNGLRVQDVPVVWVEDPDTRVNVQRTVLRDLKGLARLRFRGVGNVTPPASGTVDTGDP
ncbi:MAG: glycosyltransferase [Dehalococcoidia bacterium]|nr:glycosyltransferase [Dehalococcoidia bacterium]